LDSGFLQSILFFNFSLPSCIQSHVRSQLTQRFFLFQSRSTVFQRGHFLFESFVLTVVLFLQFTVVVSLFWPWPRPSVFLMFLVFLRVLQVLYFLLDLFQGHRIAEYLLSHLLLALLDHHEWILLESKKSFVLVWCKTLRVSLVFGSDSLSKAIAGRLCFGLFCW
jgi:hypothetical protein